MDSVSVDFEINGIRVENSDDSFEIPLQAITGVLSTTVQSLPQQQPPTPPRTPSAGLNMTDGGVVTPIGIFFNSMMMIVSVAWEKEVIWVLPNFVLDGDPHSIQFFELFLPLGRNNSKN